ncbi:MAG TPA: GNAT family N-acetyltransferase [Candidatus Nitrosocosmicus sp.]|nr:GNAT family N-acetyltransferase [Candidatus Nitrosocosmicus sp.]
MSIRVRSIEKADAGICGKIGFKAHKAISSTHGFPSEQPSEEYAVGLIEMLLNNHNTWGFVAEKDTQIIGSIFLHRFPPSPVAVIGPLTVDPSVQGGIGRVLMEAAISHAYSQNYDKVRLVQSPSHIRSFVLYTKSGFTLREPLFLMQGNAINKNQGMKSLGLHKVETDKDVMDCCKLSIQAHGFTREGELRQAMSQGVAIEIERGGKIQGYSAGLGLFGHSVASTNEGLKALIEGSSVITGPGFFVPARNREIVTWLLRQGFKIQWPANLMTLGPYVEPTIPFLPSLAY